MSSLVFSLLSCLSNDSPLGTKGNISLLLFNLTQDRSSFHTAVENPIRNTQCTKYAEVFLDCVQSKDLGFFGC